MTALHNMHDTRINVQIFCAVAQVCILAVLYLETCASGHLKPCLEGGNSIQLGVLKQRKPTFTSCGREMEISPG